MSDIHAGWRRQAEQWLADLDASAQRRVRNQHLEAIIDAGVGLGGVLLLRWSPFPLMLFLIASLWLGLLERLLEWLVDRDRLVRNLNEEDDVTELQSLVRRERDGVQPPETENPLQVSPGTSLAITVGVAAAFTGSLLYQLGKEAGLHLGSLLLERPDLLFLMGGLLTLRLYGLQQRLRRPPERAPWLAMPSPVVDLLIFVALLFCWTVLGAIALKLQEIHGGDRQYIAAIVFVCAGYGLVIWRALAEMRMLKQLREDLAWVVAQQTDSRPG